MLGNALGQEAPISGELGISSEIRRIPDGSWAPLFDNSSDSVEILDRDGGLLWINARGRRALGIDDPAEWVGRPWRDLWPVEADPELARALAAARGGAVGRLQGMRAGRTGAARRWSVAVSRFGLGKGRATGFLAVARDAPGRSTAAEFPSPDMPADTLTGLIPREQFKAVLDRRLLGRTGGGGPTALMLLEIDRLRRLNEVYGYEAGDALLRAFGRRLATAPVELAGRLGDGEFAVLLTLAPGADLQKWGRGMLADLGKPVRYGRRRLEFGVSAGVAIFPRHGRTTAELLGSADAALGMAKSGAGGRLAVLDGEARQALRRRASAYELAAQAVADGAIFPCYQAKVDLRTGRPAGFEALLRWRSPDGAVQPPAAIAAALDDPELGPQIGEIMLEAVIRDVVRWREHGLRVPVAVNLAEVQLRQDGFVERLLGRIVRAGLATSDIELEVTETVALDRRREEVGRALGALSAAGVRIALDDFGTGCAALSHLKQYPVDILKIDRSFVSGLPDDARDQAIVRSLVELASALSLEVVAEGVETAAQAAFLQSIGCHLAQGFLFGQPASGRRTLLAHAGPVSVAAE